MKLQYKKNTIYFTLCFLLWISRPRSPEEVRHYFLTNLMHPTHLIILFPHGMSPSLLTVSFLNYSNDRLSHVTMITWTKRDKSHWMVLAIPAFYPKGLIYYSWCTDTWYLWRKRISKRKIMNNSIDVECFLVY